MELASERLELPVEQLAVEAGEIYCTKNSAKRVTYAELAKGQQIERHIKGEPQTKDSSEYKVVGKPLLHRDAMEKVTGEAKFAGDLRFPGMLYAKILRPPAHDATLISVDTSAAEAMEGVQVVKDGDLIAALHELPDVAEAAVAKIKAKYDRPVANVDDKTIFDHLLKTASESDDRANGGDLEQGREMSAHVIEEKYLNSYVAHAPMENHTAIAKVDGSKVTVWASTQAPFRVKDQVAEALGLSAENVRIIAPFVGGGFGGKTRCQQGIEAARLAKLTGKPVQVAWSRAEEFFYDTFRPAAVVKITSGITDTGKISLWDYGVYYAGSRGSEQFYDIPHHRTTTYSGGSAHPFGTGAWRAPANNTNTFARESQIDIMAAKAGIDPLEFRLKNLKNEKVIRVLKAAAEKFGWTPSMMRSPSIRGYGIACGTDVGTWVALMAEVEVDENGNVQVKRVVCAQDMGLVVNPQGATIQAEGCILMGLGYALSEEIRFKGGEILDNNFDTYEFTRFSWTPEIETVLIDSDAPSQGGGEPAIICMGGVIANAVFDATGARLFQLPMTPERIKEAMQRG